MAIMLEYIRRKSLFFSSATELMRFSCSFFSLAASSAVRSAASIFFFASFAS